jgi:hypothetical protein
MMTDLIVKIMAELLSVLEDKQLVVDTLSSEAKGM